MAFRDDAGYTSTTAGNGSFTTTIPLEERIHDDACWVLENVGLKVYCDENGTIHNERLREMVDTLKEAGLVTYSNITLEKEEDKHHTNRLYISRDLIDACIESAPTIADFTERYGIQRHSFGGGQRASYVRRDGKQVEPTYEDLEEFAKRAQRYDIPFMFTPVSNDFTSREERRGLTKEEKRELRIERNEIEPMRRMANNYNGLHIWNVNSKRGIRFVKDYQDKMGGKALTAHSSTKNPLTINQTCLDSMFDCLDEGLGVYDTSMLFGGAFAPASMYPLATQAHAEGLAGLVIAQSYSPGSMYIDGAYPAIMSSRHKGELALGTPALTMTNYIVSRVLNHLDIPHMQSGLTTDDVDFIEPGKYTEDHADKSIHGPGEFTNIDTENAMQWLYKRNSFLASRHGVTGFLKGLLDVSHEYMEHNCRYLNHLKETVPVETQSSPLPEFLLHTDMDEVISAANNGRMLNADPDEMQMANRFLIMEGIYEKGGNYERMPHTTRNLTVLNNMDFFEI